MKARDACNRFFKATASIANHTAGTATGSLIGFVVGPYALAGKTFLDAYAKGYGNTKSKIADTEIPEKISSMPVVLIPGLVGGLGYGPIRGGSLGYKSGFKSSFFEVPKELFTYRTNEEKDEIRNNTKKNKK